MKPKILFILHLPPPIHGAAMMGKYIAESQLVNDTFDCKYINLATAKDLADIGKVGISKIVQFTKLLKTIRKEVKSFSPDLVYITPNAADGAFYKDFVVVQMLKRMGCKVVGHYHNKGVRERENKLLDNKLYRIFFKGLRVILLSDLLYYDIAKYVEKKNVFFCANGIEKVNIVAPQKTSTATYATLIFLSNLIISKGLWILLDACHKLKERGYHFKCNIVGGETKEVDSILLKNEIKKRELDHFVTYLGKKYGTEKTVILQNSDILIFPTFYHNETFGLVLVEAMEQRLPCISTFEGAIPSVIDDGKTGLLVPQQDATALADKIAYLLDNPEIAIAMGKEGEKKFHAQYTLEQFEKNITVILKECING